MSSRELDVMIIGAGVSGLTTAICLAEAGLRVGVRAAEPPEATTSAAAGALWGPYLVGIDERIPRWTQVTLARFLDMTDDRATGVRLTAGTEASSTAPTQALTQAQTQPPTQPPSSAHALPDWISTADGQPPQPATTLPPGYVTGWKFTAPVIAMPVYLGYLRARLERAGADVRGGCRFGSLAEAAAAAKQAGAPVIVNCAGIGARDLVPDPEVTPVRGQVVVMTNPGISEFFVGTGADPDDLTYLFPHQDTIALGGTQQPGDWRTDPDQATADLIISRCTVIEPQLAAAELIAHRVGLRPTRPSVRLESEDLGSGQRLWHNYGHGGAGVTLSWGCALDVAQAILG
jgi:D-amino-acid oxidase